ncbi:hypothetical protein M409DRAFT_51244 [Zasmidium cellare ATCC 36951]|uniref:DUF1772-domain-containing protein n=1 Tax=Zasmidium cellare ATCC 36951 TaxID=1080233 RepID=A0A6A6CXV1_ZASCE|nr:uncharacterized protein M409DRAFT_51244 [Zasmidium cellare ATCC 36951]KAF2171010.1 hypothetical protein M409DRAFT_51244 [Zasmidium cellare ATCC 36951]
MDSTEAAKLIAIPAALIVSGYQLALSQNSLPIVLNEAASVSTPIFKQVYNRGAVIAVPGALVASTAFGYLAYTTHNSTHRWLFTTGAILTFGVLPFTRLVMYGGIQRLIEISGSSTVQERSGAEVTKSLKAWTVQNWVRCGMMLTAGFAGLVTAFV